MTDNLKAELSMLNTISFLREQIIKAEEESEAAKEINIYKYAYLKGKKSAYNEAAEVAEINITRAKAIK